MGVSGEAMEVREASAGYGLQAAEPGVPVGYKQTEVGVIPEDWEVQPLGQKASFRTGPFGSALHKSDYTTDGIPIVNPMHIVDGKIEPTRTMSVTEQAAKSLSVFRLKPDEIVIGRRGDMGRCAVVLEHQSGWLCGTGSMIIRPLGFDANFLQKVLSSPRVISDIEDSSVGTTMVNLNQSTLSGLKVQFPSEPEQRAIATALSDMDALLDGLDQLIAKKRDLKQATMQQLLTGQTRLPGFEREWEDVRLLEKVVLIHGKAHEPYVNESGTYVVVNSKFISSEGKVFKHCSTNLCLATTGDVLMVLSDLPNGRALAKCYLVKIENRYAINQRVCIFRSVTIDPKFLFYTLNRNSYFLSLDDGVTQTHILNGDIARCELRVPMSRNEQKAIASIISDMDAEIEALEQRRNKTRDLKQAMMQELLTGRTRLIKPLNKDSAEDKTASGEKKANVHFRRSVLAAEIIDQLHEEPTFGHVKFEKVLFLVEHLCEVDTGSTYRRQAAGPYDNRALRSIDSQLRKQQWFEAQKGGERYRYVPLNKQGGHKTYFDRYFSGVSTNLMEIIETFRTFDTERCEIVATLFSAWSDLLREKGTVSDDMIVHEVLNNWHESKKRIAEDRWLAALGWMREKGFVPKEFTSA